MQRLGTSTSIEDSNNEMGSHGMVGSSEGTLERERDSLNLYSEGASLNLIQENVEEDVSTEALPPPNKKFRSTVWKDFQFTMLDNASTKAICKHCNKGFVAGNKAGTSHLRYHIGVCPKLSLSKRRKFGSPKVDMPVFDQQRSRDDFARMVLGHGYCLEEMKW